MDCTAASEVEKLGTTMAATWGLCGMCSRSVATTVSATCRLVFSSESSRDMFSSCGVKGRAQVFSFVVSVVLLRKTTHSHTKRNIESNLQCKVCKQCLSEQCVSPREQS